MFQRTTETPADLFVGMRLGYALDLPLGFFVGVRGEERIAPAQTTLQVVGANPSVTTETWTFQGLGFVGYRFL